MKTLPFFKLIMIMPAVCMMLSANGQYLLDNPIKFAHSTFQSEANFSSSKPGPLDVDQVVGEFLLGGFMGIAGGIVGAVLPPCDGMLEFACDENILQVLAGSILGTATGVYIVGTNHEVKGRYLLALGGAAAGMCVGAGLYAILEDEDEVLGSISLIMLPPITAMVLFNSSRRYKSPQHTRKLSAGLSQAGLTLKYSF